MIRAHYLAVFIGGLSLVALGAFAKPTPGNTGKWVTRTPVPVASSPYLKVALKVNKVSTVTNWTGLGKLIRFGADEKKQTQAVRDAIQSHKFKVILVNLSLRNDTAREMNLGYYVNLNSGSESVSDAFRIWLRGEEGTELCGGDNLDFGDGWKNAGLHLTYFLSNGMPMSAAVPAKGTVTGTVAFVVKDWFVPAKVFTRRYASGLPDLGLSVK